MSRRKTLKASSECSGSENEGDAVEGRAEPTPLRAMPVSAGAARPEQGGGGLPERGPLRAALGAAGGDTL